MKTFTIENETNKITIHPSEKEGEAILDSERFSDEAAFTKLAADWPASRLIETWSGQPGATPVAKFKDRKTAVSRIWKALQSLSETVQAEAVEAGTEPNAERPQEAEIVARPQAEATPEPLPQAAEPAISESPEGDLAAAVTPQTAHVATEQAAAKNKATPAKRTPAAAAAPSLPRAGSKTSRVISMLKREGGATLEEIMASMGWQKHTTRAMLSAGGSLVKKHRLLIASDKVGEKRIYSIKG